jgi:hypothetical protein
MAEVQAPEWDQVLASPIPQEFRVDTGMLLGRHHLVTLWAGTCSVYPGLGQAVLRQAGY